MFGNFTGMSFSLIIHHGGHFEVGENTGYNGGDLAVANINDVDRWSFFEAVGLVRDLGYKEDFLLWWNSDSAEYEGGYKSLKVDNDAVKCAEFALLHNCDIQLYVESLVGETIDGESSGKGVEKEGEGNVESDPEHGVHFDDSEEERALGLDDGFEDELTVKSPKGRRKVCSTHKASSPAKRAAMGMILDSSSDEDADYEMEDDYESEELYSSATESEEDNTGLKKMRYPVFKKEEFNKDYKFMIGLEFRSIGEFKEVMLEYAVLNGRELKYKKNEPNRARLVCKRDCGYETFCSRVGQTHTYRLKTYKGRHTCGRVFNNKNANSKWVSKLVAERLMSTNKVKIVEVMTEIKRKYATGITVGRAWKGIKMARDRVEGDATKQYSLLWSYASELLRANQGNTCKINVNRVPPSLLPRFGAFYFCLNGTKRGFQSGCRPFIGVDGCHLKTKYGGQLLIAVGRDPNDQYYPIAFGVVENETKESWRWFLTLLLGDIGHEHRWVFISDQQKV